MSTFRPTPTTARLSGRKAGNLFIAAVVWCGGVVFTRGALPLPAGTDALGIAAPWAIAVIIQLALSLGQSNLRDRGFDTSRWPYWLLVGVDVAANAIGLLVAYKVVTTPAAALLFALRAVTEGAGLWQVAAAIVAGVIVAVLPELLVRDAQGG